MGLQVLWSFGLACLDVFALRRKRDLQNPILVSLFVIGDWVFTHFLNSIVFRWLNRSLIFVFLWIICDPVLFRTMRETFSILYFLYLPVSQQASHLFSVFFFAPLFLFMVNYMINRSYQCGFSIDWTISKVWLCCCYYREDFERNSSTISSSFGLQMLDSWTLLSLSLSLSLTSIVKY